MATYPANGSNADVWDAALKLYLDEELVNGQRDAAATWAAGNPTLDAGQVGIETDTGKYKIGDGATAWNTLAYAGGPSTATPGQLLKADASGLPVDASSTDAEVSGAVSHAGTEDAINGLVSVDGAGNYSAKTLSAFGETLIDDADAPRAKQTLILPDSKTQDWWSGGLSEDIGRAWSDLGQQFSQAGIRSLAYLGNGICLAGTSGGGKILRSTDYGATWSDLGQQFSQTYILSLAYLGNGICLAGTYPDSKILRSSSL